MRDLEKDVDQLTETVLALAERCDGLQAAIENLSLENQAIRLQLQAQEHGRTLMRHLERQ